MTGRAVVTRTRAKADQATEPHRWTLVHQTLNADGGVPVVELVEFADPGKAVERLKRCSGGGCSPECRRARKAGRLSYVRQVAA